MLIHMKLLTILLFIYLNSCAFLYRGNPERELQTKIHQKIMEKSPEFKKCAQNSDVFDHFETNRIVSTLFLEINPRGELEKFKLDEKDYPSDYVDCFFGQIELINFPKNNNDALIKIEQPFVFTKN